MTLFFCAWRDEDDAPESAIVDAASEADARELLAAYEDEPPARIVPLRPGVFFASLHFDEVDELTLQPSDECDGALRALEDGPAVAGEAACGDEAEDEGGDVLACALPEGHDGDHVAAGGWSWEADDEDAGSDKPMRLTP